MDMPNAKNEGTIGQRLMVWLDDELKARGITPNAFGKLVPFDPSSFSRWRDGKIEMPSIPVFRQIADALGVSLLTVLDGIGLLNRDERQGIERVEVNAVPSLDDAIDRDPTLTPSERKMYQDIRRETRGKSPRSGRPRK